MAAAVRVFVVDLIMITSSFGLEDSAIQAASFLVHNPRLREKLNLFLIYYCLSCLEGLNVCERAAAKHFGIHSGKTLCRMRVAFT